MNDSYNHQHLPCAASTDATLPGSDADAERNDVTGTATDSPTTTEIADAGVPEVKAPSEQDAQGYIGHKVDERPNSDYTAPQG